MTICQLNTTRFPELFEVHLPRWPHSTRVEVVNLTDEELEDVGLKPPKRDFDTVKPFWMP
jgi:hypothetical protein